MSIPILMYHQIDEPPPRGTPLRGLVVSPTSFARQMKMLRLLGYRGMSMRELEPYLSGEKEGKVVGVTFDDGYENNLTHALPILKECGFTATCYGVSRLLGNTNRWDADKVVAKPLMSVAQWRIWHESGMDIGSHTCTHADLNAQEEDVARAEITLSKSELENAIGCEVRHFCYPYGRYKPVHATIVKQAGYVTATTTRRGRVKAGDDLFTLNRVMVARATSWVQFAVKLLTNYEDQKS